MGFLDFLTLGYIVFGIFMGRKRGLFRELPDALSVLIFFITGCGLYRWTGRALSEMNQLAGQSLGVGSFLGLVTGVFALVKHFRHQVSGWAERRFDERTQKLGGGIAGGVRTFTLVAVVLLVFAHWPLHGLTRPLVKSSLLGRALIKFVLPVYGTTHGAL
jgi:uncharacterized membrane protein required for colicin V production